MKKHVLTGVQALLTLAFLSAGMAKVFGAEMMVQVFDTVGIGQWFRYVTGIIEIAGALALWLPALRGFAALGLTATMGGAVLAHVFILGPSALPALVLGSLSALIAWDARATLAQLKA